MSIQSTQLTKEISMKPSTLASRAKKLMKETRGASLVEYALLLAVMIIVGAAVFKALGAKVSEKATGAAAELDK